MTRPCEAPVANARRPNRTVVARSARQSERRAWNGIRRMLWRCAALVALAAVALCSGRTSRGDEPIDRLVAGLRQRQLWKLADEYCTRVAANPKLTEFERSVLTVEWQRTLAEQATLAAAAERAELVARLRRLGADFLRGRADHPRAILVQAQEALGLLAIGEAVRREAELVEASATVPGGNSDGAKNSSASVEAATTRPQLETLYNEARQLLRDGARLVDALDRELDQTIPQRFRRPLPPPALTADELTGLQNNLRFQSTRSQRQLALCYETTSADRRGALAAALVQVDKTLRGVPADDPVEPRLRLERAILLRLLERGAEVDEALSDDAWSVAPLELRQAAEAERLRWWLQSGRLAEAKRMAEACRERAEPRSAELDFACFETHLARWRAAESRRATDEAAQCEQDAIRTLESLERQHGSGWKRRADLLFVRAASAGGGARGRAALLRTGDVFFRQARFDDAVAAYDQAAKLASEAKDEAGAAELLNKAAMVEQQRARHGDAATRFERLATSFPTDARAALANQLAAWNTAQALRTSTDPAQREQLSASYRRLLERQLERWPDATPTDEARVWLGRWHESQRDFARAVEVYRGVRSTSPQFTAAVEGAGRAWLALLEELRAKPPERRRVADEAGEFFERAAYDGGSDDDATWSDRQRQAALFAARVWLDAGPAASVRVERLLRTAIERSKEPPAEWLAAARALLLVALAGQASRQDEARALVEQLGALHPTVLVDAATRIGALRVAADSESQPRLARLELQLIASVASRRAELSAADRKRIDLERAAALAIVGPATEALDAYRELARQFPADGKIAESLAEQLLASERPEDWRAGLDAWRRIVAKSPPRSLRWWRGKYGIALAELKLGRPKEAAQLIKFLQATPPGLAESPLEAQFLELLKRCEPK